MLTIPIHAPPGQANNSELLTKFNDDCCSNMCPGSHKHIYHNSNKKEDVPAMGHILLSITWIYACPYTSHGRRPSSFGLRPQEEWELRFPNEKALKSILIYHGVYF